MKNYTILPLYKKNKNKFINTYIYWYKQYITTLDNELWSLIDYLYQFNPNYMIFNQKEDSSVSYYSFDQLTKLHVLMSDAYSFLTEDVLNSSKLFINVPQLLLHTGIVNDFNNYNEVYLYWNENITQKLEEAEIVLSKATNIGLDGNFINEPTNSARQNPDNYFIGRLAANNCYYIISAVYPTIKPNVDKDEEKKYDNLNNLIFSFVTDAEEKYGNIVNLNLYFPRFYYIEEWPGYSGLTIENNFAKSEFTLKGNKTVWTGLEQVNHDFTINTDTGQERIITDDISFQSFRSSEVVKIKNPYYSINIENDQKPFSGNFQVDIW